VPRLNIAGPILGLALVGLGTLAAGGGRGEGVVLGPRPLALVEDMDPGGLKETLLGCAADEAYPTDFSIGHRGAPLLFPEHTKESYEAAARTGAGILECDVTFTRDLELVCRHSQCDLHTTTNILTTALARKCRQPFTPAAFDDTGRLVRSASARCCTSDLTLDEFKSLKGKRDGADPSARTVEEYMAVPAGGPSDLYPLPEPDPEEVSSRGGTLMTHAESIELFQRLGVKMTPELKSPSVEMPFEGFTQEDYAQKMIDEYEAAGVPARHVWAQSFDLDDVRYWIEHAPAFGRQAVYLDGRSRDPAFDPADPETWSPTMEELVAMKVRVIAPPIWMLLSTEDGRIVPSAYARAARGAGLDIITWTLERSGPLAGGGDWYYQTVKELIDNDGDMLTVLDVLARDVGIVGIFSDWPATVTFYANCMERRLGRRDGDVGAHDLYRRDVARGQPSGEPGRDRAEATLRLSSSAP
jgi:glycerophosphoryl diester phosphodiesterase